MKAVHKIKVVTYKNAKFMSGNGDLQKLLHSALQSKKQVGSRKHLLDASEKTFVLINNFRNKLNMLFGTMLIYSQGKNQPLITEDDAADELELDQIVPPHGSGGKRRDFVESILYFGIFHNHVLLLQSTSLRTRDFENYLNWFLQEKATVLNSNDRVYLSDQPSTKLITKLNSTGAKSVVIGTSLSSVTVNQTQQVKFKPAGTGFDLIEAVLGSDWMKKIELKDALDEANLQVALEITYSRSTTKNAQKLLNNIATSLRHIDPDEVTIKLNGGGKITGDELKLNGSISVNSHGGLLDMDDLYPRMHTWLTDSIKSSVIDA